MPQIKSALLNQSTADRRARASLLLTDFGKRGVTRYIEGLKKGAEVTQGGKTVRVTAEQAREPFSVK